MSIALDSVFGLFGGLEYYAAFLLLSQYKRILHCFVLFLVLSNHRAVIDEDVFPSPKIKEDTGAAVMMSFRN